MTNPDCEVCCGRGTIRLPLYRRTALVSHDLGNIASMDDASRTYPCPECSDVVASDNVAVLNAFAVVDSRYERAPRYMEMVKESTAHLLVDELLKAGFIRVECGPPIAGEFKFKAVATLAAVSQAHVATLKQRIAERQEELAIEVVAVAEEQARHWGSHYTGRNGPIEKGKVLEYLREALRGALAKRSEMKAA